MTRTQIAELNFVAGAGGRPSSTTRRSTISSVRRSPSSSHPNRTSNRISCTSGNGWQPDALVSCSSTEAIESIPVSVTPLRELRYAPTRDLSSSQSAFIDHGGAADLKRAFFSSCEARGSSPRWLSTGRRLGNRVGDGGLDGRGRRGGGGGRVGLRPAGGEAQAGRHAGERDDRDQVAVVEVGDHDRDHQQGDGG